MRQACIFLHPQSLASSVSLPLETLTAAENFYRGRRRQRMPVMQSRLIAVDQQAVICSGGMRIQPDCSINELNQPDLIVLPALWRNPLRVLRCNSKVLDWLQEAHQNGCQICAVGTGSYFLAEAGLLDGRPATTHWYYFDDFQRRYPQIQLQRRHLITQADTLYCAGSVNSIVDLMVHFILHFYDEATARQVEGHFSPEIRQSYEQHLYNDSWELLHHDEDIVRTQHWMHSHYGQNVSIQSLASEIGLSTRSLNRRFKAATGQTPLTYLQNIRLSIARELLRDSNLSIAEIADKVGYSDGSYFSSLFQRQMQQSPLTYRQRVRGKLFKTQLFRVQ